MKGLFVVFHGFSAHNGISKKIYYQRDALRRCGIDLKLCFLETDAAGRQKRMLDETVLEDFGTGIGAKLRKRFCYGAVTRYVRENGISLMYVRYDHNANPVLIGWFRALQKAGVNILLEIPTYPYDAEYARSPWRRRLRLLSDRLFRLRLARYVHKIVTFTDYPEIFGVPTIRISNGIDFARVGMKTTVNDASRNLNLIGVAQIHFWHGFDRVIEGLAAYRANGGKREVTFHVVGEGAHGELERLKELARRYSLEDRVLFYGTRSGEGLDEVFETCDMGIASLGRHRNGIDRIKTLKNREYAARGIPFVYSETDSDFDDMPYVMKAPADESPLDIEAVVRFYDSVRMTPAEIRATVAETLSWDAQMKKVLEQL